MATPKSHAKKTAPGEEKGSFEKSLKRLEAIAEELEGGSVSLDEAMKIYEEGIQISRKCLERLSEIELKLKRLSKDIQGNFELVDEGEVSE